MKHFVNPTSPGRIGVCYMIPGTNIASVVCDALIASRPQMVQMAAELSKESTPFIPVEERHIPVGFYGPAQGDLF